MASPSVAVFDATIDFVENALEVFVR